jgi:hypothetical protein
MSLGYAANQYTQSVEIDPGDRVVHGERLSPNMKPG